MRENFTFRHKSSSWFFFSETPEERDRKRNWAFLINFYSRELKNWPWPTKLTHFLFHFNSNENNIAAHYESVLKCLSGWPILILYVHSLLFYFTFLTRFIAASQSSVQENYLTVLHMILTIEKMPRDWLREIVSRPS